MAIDAGLLNVRAGKQPSPVCDRRRGRRCQGFTLLELLIAAAIVVVLFAFIMSAVNRSRSAAHTATCLSNLHTIALGLTQNARDHGDYFPDPVALNISWEQCIRPYVINAQVFQCPSDNEIYPSVGSSYDWRDTGVLNTTLAGHSHNDINRSGAVLVFESLPGWHGKGKINAATVDTTAQLMDQGQCLTDLQMPIRR